MSIKNMASGLGISDVSVVIPTNHQREAELQNVVTHLKSLGFEDIILAEGSKRMYNRYEAVWGAKNEVIYTQDDDCIISNIKELLGAYRPDRITANSKMERMLWYEDLYAGRVCLVGYGAIFHRDLVKNMNKYLDEHGEDHLFYREADRVFTWLNEKKIIVADKSIKDFPAAFGGLSFEPDHWKSMDVMIRRLKNL